MKNLLATAAIFLPLLLTQAAPMGSTKNFYLVTCTDGTGRQDNFDAIASYPKGPSTSTSTLPAELAEVSRPRGTWEGVTREAEFKGDNWFIAKIDKAAAKLAKGEIAGSGSFEGEPFVCFKRDGELLFENKKEDVKCQQRYWCPSIDVGSVPA